MVIDNCASFNKDFFLLIICTKMWCDNWMLHKWLNNIVCIVHKMDSNYVQRCLCAETFCSVCNIMYNNNMLWIFLTNGTCKCRTIKVQYGRNGGHFVSFTTWSLFCLLSVKLLYELVWRMGDCFKQYLLSTDWVFTWT